MRFKTPWTLRWVRSMADIPQTAWDLLAEPLQTPLLEWQWLHDLEASGSIVPQAGWYPCHLTVWRADRLVAAAPLYIKTHSEGEFVFDHWWARWAGEYGIVYYPKLVGMSPVTPAVGYRFLMAEDIDQDAVQRAMLNAIDAFCKELGISGCHFNFVDPGWSVAVSAKGFLEWRHQSYLWRNEQFATFEDYLQPFKSIQRRNIRRECLRMEKLGIEIKALTGRQITPDLAPLMYRYYEKTNAQYGPWQAKYLNADFFTRAFRSYAHRLLLMAAYQKTAGALPMALSMLLIKNNHLIGRYWGCAHGVKDLHFNMCFYGPIRWAIDHGVQTFDPGAGSPHKIQRGFQAVANTSLHRFYDPRLKALFLRLIDGINEVEQANIDELNRQLPLKATL